MAYREENEHLKARVRQLEAELKVAEQRVAVTRPVAPPPTLGDALRGGPGRVRIERDVYGEVDDDAADRILEIMRSRYGQVGRAERIGGSLAWSSAGPGASRVVELTVSWRDGTTHLRGTENFGNLTGGLFGGVLGGAGVGGMGLLLPIVGLAGFARLMTTAGVLWLMLVYAITRQIYRGVTARRAEQLQAALAEVAGCIKSPGDERG